MNAARYNFLADAALAGDENLRIAARDAIDLGLEGMNLAALTDEPEVLLAARPRTTRNC